MAETKLKPCPFCGGEAELDFVGEEFYMVRCGKCASATSFAKEYENGTAGDSTKAETIEAWNRRVNMDKTDFLIIQKPIAISLCCPHCDTNIEIPWDELDVPEYWGDDWDSAECPCCGKTIELGDYDID